MSSLDPEQYTGGSIALPKVVVGLDFGTTFSGAVYSTENNTVSMCPCSPDLSSGDGDAKVPTALLWRDDDTWEFGRAAVQAYKYMLQSAAEDSTIPGSLFTDFKWN
jgi:molecular chaperone DnaK (HSP70)